MKKSILISLLVLIASFGGGALLFTYLFSEDAPPPTTEPRARIDLPAQVNPDAAIPDDLRAIRATKVEGTVERRSEERPWTTVNVGDKLDATDEVRVGLDASASFSIGDSTTVEAPHDTRFRFLEISEAVSKIRLDDGQLASSTRGAQLRIEVKNSDAVAETSEGDFAISTAGSGQVAVASKRGSVSLSAQGEQVQIEAGTQSIVAPNSAPSRPTEIPSSLFLKVNRPKADRDLQTTVVRGTATPGSIIDIAGTKTAVPANGEFKTRVALVEGSRDITVNVLDPIGRSSSVSVRVIAPGASTTGSVEW